MASKAMRPLDGAKLNRVSIMFASFAFLETQSTPQGAWKLLYYGVSSGNTF